MSEKICVFTCATKSTPHLDVLRKSTEIYKGWGLCVLSEGKEWKSFRTKMEAYRDALQVTKKDQIVVCLDAYDVICVRDSDDFKKEFRSFHTPIVVSNENLCVFTIYNQHVKVGACAPISKWKKYHHVDTTKSIHVNSGCIVGYAGDVYNMFDWILNYDQLEIDDDQIGVGYYMNEFPQKVKLDLENKLFLNDNFAKFYKIQVHGDQLLVNVPNKPYFIHFPGVKLVDPFLQTNYDVVSNFVVGKHQQNRNRGRNRILLLLFVCVLLIVLTLLFIVIKNQFRLSNKRKKKTFS